MPKFDASSFEDCEYDFTGIKSVFDGAYIQDKGVVPEPSRKLVSETMTKISEAFNQIKGKDTPDVEANPEAIKEALKNVDDDEFFEKMSTQLLDVITKFCQGSPRPESLEALPWPRFMSFFGYVMENMLSPEASVPGTNDTPKRLRSV